MKSSLQQTSLPGIKMTQKSKLSTNELARISESGVLSDSVA